MSRPDLLRRPPGSNRKRRAHLLLAVVLAVAVIVTVPVLWSLVPSASPSPLPGPTFPTVAASLGGPNGSVIPFYPSLLGVNLRADVPFSSASQSALHATGVGVVRWPGGGDGDRLDPLANGGSGSIFSDTGISTPPATTLAEFVEWCRSVSCRAIVTLPAEIDDPSFAAAIVNYTEHDLGFFPAYWEVGNEPALWTHYAVPWDRWNLSQNLTPTPAEYANLVHTYVGAIRAIDPSTGIIGLGGVGGSASPQSSWISATVSVNGPNLTAIAIHVYPAGSGFPSASIPLWFATLQGRSALPHRVESALGSMTRACPSCRLELLADEFQTGTLLTSATSLSGGYQAAYIAAEIVQSLTLPLTSLVYYNFQSATPGAWLNSAGEPSAAYVLYRALESDLGGFAQGINLTAAASGLLGAEGGASPGSITSLVLVNTNTTFGFRLNLSARFPAASGGTAWLFDGPAALPISETVGPGGATGWTVPPASVVILSDIGAPLATG